MAPKHKSGPHPSATRNWASTCVENGAALQSRRLVSAPDHASGCVQAAPQLSFGSPTSSRWGGSWPGHTGPVFSAGLDAASLHTGVISRLRRSSKAPSWCLLVPSWCRLGAVPAPFWWRHSSLTTLALGRFADTPYSRPPCTLAGRVPDERPSCAQGPCSSGRLPRGRSR